MKGKRYMTEDKIRILREADKGCACRPPGARWCAGVSPRVFSDQSHSGAGTSGPGTSSRTPRCVAEPSGCSRSWTSTPGRVPRAASGPGVARRRRARLVGKSHPGARRTRIPAQRQRLGSSLPKRSSAGWPRTVSKTICIEPGSPWQNGFVESFHGRFRDECLNREQALDLERSARGH